MRQSIQYRLRTFLTALVVTVQVLVYPAAAFAQETTDVPPTESEQSQVVEDTPTAESQSAPVAQDVVQQPESPTPPATTGPSEPTGEDKPTGASSSSYTYNPTTGKWESDRYSWDPITKQTKPIDEPEYSYNPSTGLWDTTEWYYSPETGKYLPNSISTSVNPTLSASARNGVTNTGPNSNNTINNNGSVNANFDLYYNAAISNKIGQLSQSGDASVLGNTFGGNALTGDATSIANLLNMIQSSWGGLGSDNIATFMANINGDVTGDLYVDPSAIGSGYGNTDLTVNSQSTAAIDNDIDVTVASGDALVSNNTTGGDATSGNANAVVNLLNLINSAITANKSFVGVLNINGNLNGDILLPPEMISAIIAATGPNSNNQITQNGSNNYTLNSDTNNVINNNVNANAATGDANVSGNTTAGNATTGNANSNVVLMNLTGKKVVAKNALLVFVNVLGNWVGLIYDAPAGTNAVAATGPNSNNTISGDSNLNVTVDETRNNLINNDINVTAHSGDANVTGNTTAGNASTGNASIGVNALNLIDSDFQIDDWFGVLFINVFGSWVGSFGVNTEAGNVPPVVGVVPAPSAAASANSSPPQTFSFVPRPSSIPKSIDANQGIVAGTTEPTIPSSNSQSDSFAVPAASAPSDDNTGSGVPAGGRNMLVLAGIATFTGMLLLGGERMLSMIRVRQTA